VVDHNGVVQVVGAYYNGARVGRMVMRTAKDMQALRMRVQAATPRARDSNGSLQFQFAVCSCNAQLAARSRTANIHATLRTQLSSVDRRQQEETCRDLEAPLEKASSWYLR
jgi:hypothetical protein